MRRRREESHVGSHVTAQSSAIGEGSGAEFASTSFHGGRRRRRRRAGKVMVVEDSSPFLLFFFRSFLLLLGRVLWKLRSFQDGRSAQRRTRVLCIR